MFKYKCNNDYVSKNDKNAQCDKCGEVNENGYKFEVSRLIPYDIYHGEARDEYTHKINKFKGLIDNKFFDINIIDNYIYCDLYSGCVKLSYNNYFEKIIFVNLFSSGNKNGESNFIICFFVLVVVLPVIGLFFHLYSQSVVNQKKTFDNFDYKKYSFSNKRKSIK